MAPIELTADVPHSARIYDHLLGGKDNFAADRDAAAAIVADWPHLAISTVTADSAPEEVNKGVAAYVVRGIEEKARDRAEVADLFRGLDLIDPGVTLVNRWRPDEHAHMYGGVARKP